MQAQIVEQIDLDKMLLWQSHRTMETVKWCKQLFLQLQENMKSEGLTLEVYAVGTFVKFLFLTRQYNDLLKRLKISDLDWITNAPPAILKKTLMEIGVHLFDTEQSSSSNTTGSSGSSNVSAQEKSSYKAKYSYDAKNVSARQYDVNSDSHDVLFALHSEELLPIDIVSKEKLSLQKRKTVPQIDQVYMRIGADDKDGTQCLFYSPYLLNSLINMSYIEIDNPVGAIKEDPTRLLRILRQTVAYDFCVRINVPGKEIVSYKLQKSLLSAMNELDFCKDVFAKMPSHKVKAEFVKLFSRGLAKATLTFFQQYDLRQFRLSDLFFPGLSNMSSGCQNWFCSKLFELDNKSSPSREDFIHLATLGALARNIEYLRTHVVGSFTKDLCSILVEEYLGRRNLLNVTDDSAKKRIIDNVFYLYDVEYLKNYTGDLNKNIYKQVCDNNQYAFWSQSKPQVLLAQATQSASSIGSGQKVHVFPKLSTASTYIFVPGASLQASTASTPTPVTHNGAVTQKVLQATH